MLYSFPNHGITFYAPDDNIAAVVGLAAFNATGHISLISDETKADIAIKNYGNDALLDATCKERLGMGYAAYLRQNQKEIAESLLSFALCTPEERPAYDAKLNVIAEPENRQWAATQFLYADDKPGKHHVAAAWKLAEILSI